MQWMDTCRNTLGWQVWLLLCASVVVLWAGAIAGAIALLSSSARLSTSDGAPHRDALTRPYGGGVADADMTLTDRPS